MVVIPIAVVLTSVLIESLFGGAQAQDELPPIEVIETRFVQLGIPEPRTMPSLEAPSADEPPAPVAEPVATPEPTAAVPRPVISKKQKKKPTQSADDLLAQLGQSADAISGLSRGAQRQGHKEGIAEGTKLEGDAYDLYKGKLYAYFRRGWQVPSSIADAEIRKLACVVDVNITKDTRVGSFSISRPSGNEAFDDSVLKRMAQAEGASLPSPPEEIAHRFLGQSISLRFFGRHAR